MFYAGTVYAMHDYEYLQIYDLPLEFPYSAQAEFQADSSLPMPNNLSEEPFSINSIKLIDSQASPWAEKMMRFCKKKSEQKKKIALNEFKRQSANEQNKRD